MDQVSDIKVGKSPRRIVNLPTGSRLLPQGYQVPHGSPVAYVPNTQYVFQGPSYATGTITPTVQNIAFTGPQSKLIPITCTQGIGSTIFDMSQSGTFELAFLDFTSPSTSQIVRTGLNSYVHDIQVSSQVQQVVEADYPNGNGTIVENLIAKAPTGDRLVFICGADNVVVRGCTQLYGSLGEDVIRSISWPVPNQPDHLPANLKIEHCNLYNDSVLHKTVISLRHAINPLVQYNHVLTGWIRMGEDGSAISVFNPTLIFNTFEPDKVQINGYPIENIMCMAAGEVTINQNLFKLLVNQQAITGKPGVATFKQVDSNIKQSMDHLPMKALVYNGTHWDGTNTKSIP